MPEDEVKLGDGDMDDDYEVVPVGPIRKLERRIDEMEKQSSGSRTDDELIRDVLDIMKSNQKIVNDMTESTHELKNSVEDLTHKMDSVIDNMNSFMDLLKEASEADLEGEVIQDVHSRVADAVGNEMEEVASDIQQSNQQVIQNLEELNKSIKRSYTSQRKDQVLSGSGNQQRSRGGRNQSSNRSQGQGSPNMNPNRGNNNQQNSNRGSGGSGDSENIRKLRKRFNKMDNE